jgi:pullulanase
VYHKDINYGAINYTDFPWANNPGQSINYASAHDNLTLYDKLKVSSYDQGNEDKIKQMAKLASALVLTSQGVPFLHAGVEFLRTKFGDANSYRSPDSINALNWKMKSTNYDVFSYHKGLIELRKTYKHFRLGTQEAIANHLHFYQGENGHDHNIVAYTLTSPDEHNTETFFVAFNGNQDDRTLTLDHGQWQVLVNQDTAGIIPIETLSGRVTIAPTSTLILMKTKE